MFPLNDFNVVCCALATLSAAAGYHVAKQRRIAGLPWSSRNEPLFRHFRHGSTTSVTSACESGVDSEVSESSSSDCPTPFENPINETVPGTLKRKGRDEDPDSVTDNQGSVPTTPPRKRCKTPPSEDSDSVVKVEEADFAMLPSLTQNVLVSVTEFQEKNDVMAEANKSSITPSRPIAAQTASFPSAFSIPAVKPSSAFTAFSGTTSAFSIVSSPSSTSLKPVWCSDLVRPGPTDVGSGKAEIKPEAIAVSIDTSPEIAGAASVPAVQSGDALASHSYAKGVQNTLTGEEQERVVTELKGAKVFIKRGDREFTDGILGHVKLLSHEISGEERILFRREPVWKVSMSVRLRPTVRCTFDRAQSTLRVTLKETEEQEGVPHEQWPQHMVIYAIKRGKATKSDFEEFARGVIASTHLSLSSLDGTT